MDSNTKICLYPFTRMEANSESFIPCCFFWLTPEYFKLNHDGVDKWNSSAAEELRKRILKGDFSLCQRNVCNVPLISLDELKQYGTNIPECPVSPEIIESIDKEETILSQGVSSFSVVADRRCNLACPSCRDEKVLTLTAVDKKNVYDSLQQLKDHRNSLQSFKMTGNGEVFFSPWMKKILKIMTTKNFPQLNELIIISNGLLCTPELYKKLSPGTDHITELSISIDAGDAATYAKTRGGNWDRLQKNLKFISSLRQNGKIKRFVITFVVRAVNVHSTDDFVKLGEELGCDYIYFLSYSKWRAKKINYEEQAIHFKTHPLHDSFMLFYNKYKNYPKVHMGIQPVN